MLGANFGKGSQKRTGGIYVVTGGGGEGVIDVSISTLGISNSSVVSGSSRTLTLQLKNSNGVNIATGGAVIVPSKSGGTATGTLSSVTDNNDGSYTWTFTGVLAGTATTFSCTINGVAFSGTKPTCAVTPGAIDRTVSVVTIGSSSIAEGATVVLTLQAKDAAGNNLVAGGSTIAFNHSGGTAVISIGSVTDVGNGTYTATVTATTAGTATTFSATIGGSAVTTTMPTLTVTAAVTLIFSSKWSFATGNSDNALADGSYGTTGKWNALTGGIINTVCNIVPLASEGLNSGGTAIDALNALQINHQTPSPSSGQPGINGIWTSPQVGESRYWRLYLYNNIANDEGNRGESHHPVETIRGSGNNAWQFNFTTNSDGTFNFFIWTDPPGTVGASTKWYPDTGSSHQVHLPKFAWLRFEIKMTKTAANLYIFDIRVYNSSDVLLYGKASDSPTLGNWKNATGTVDVTDAAIGMSDAQLDGFEVGTSGGSDLSNLIRIERTYYAAVAIASNNWIGPYSAVRGY